MPVESPPISAATEPRPPLIDRTQTFRSMTDKVSDIALVDPTPRGWYFGFGIACLLVMLLLYAVGYLFVVGVGIWGVNIPVGWGLDIINFVWWISIGHAGTLISATLLLCQQKWRTSINRFTEAMTLFAVACAGLFPLLHLGRPWYFYWLFPYPSTSAVWPQFRSPLVWDVFSITTHLVASLLFWYVGLIPDLATFRDRARTRFAGKIFAVVALGWRGDAIHWHRQRIAYLLLAGLAIPLAISAQSIVAFDFAVSVVPGWHSTVFPPFFIVSAMLSWFAVVLVAIIPVRRIYRLHRLITERHLDNLAKFLLATCLMVSFAYFVEFFMAWYGGKSFDWHVLMLRMFGPYALSFWVMIVCNVIAPQTLWFPSLRRRPLVLWSVGFVVLIGMWLERYLIVVSSLHQDYLPSSWGGYTATIWDWATFAGTVGLFFALLLLFVRYLPMVSIHETRELLPEADKPTDAATENPCP